MVFVGFVAEKESGKTTTFNFIKELLPQARELMLAEHLKETCAKAFNLSLAFLESQAERKKIFSDPIVLTRDHIKTISDSFEMTLSEQEVNKHVDFKLTTTRQILQYVGTDILRAVEDDIHLRWAMRRAPKADVYVVTDIRFPNEFAFFDNKDNFLPFYIERKKSTEADASAAHASETHIPNLRKLCLAEIINNGTLEDLKGQVKTLILPAVLGALECQR
jgi:hypothetical protein